MFPLPPENELRPAGISRVKSDPDTMPIGAKADKGGKEQVAGLLILHRPFQTAA